MIALATPDGDDLERMTREELREELSRALALTVEGLRRAARVWGLLERMGEDLSDLRTGIAAYVPLIAAGTVLPEAVIAFAGNRTLLRKVAELPPAEQKRLATGGAVEVVERRPDGQ